MVDFPRPGIIVVCGTDFKSDELIIKNGNFIKASNFILATLFSYFMWAMSLKNGNYN